MPVAQRRDLVRLFDAWQAWMGQLRGAEDVAFRLCFRLEPPEVDPESGQVLSPDWLLRYMLQANDDPSLLVPAEQVWDARGGTLRILNRKFEGAQERLLAGLGLAGRLFPPIMKSLRTARPEACPLTVDEAYAFLREVGPLLEGSGFGVLVPPWWDKPGARLGVRARLKTPGQRRRPGHPQHGHPGAVRLGTGPGRRAADPRGVRAAGGAQDAPGAGARPVGAAPA